MCPAQRPWRSIGLLLVLVVLAAALGATASAQVATLGSPAPSASEAPASPAPEGQQALLDWAGCMREQAVEMDDPRFGLDGELIGGLGKDGVGNKSDAKSEMYQLASEACNDQLAAFKAPPDAEQQAEQAEQLLVWAGCMREQGVDLPDPNADGTFLDYEWKLDFKGDEYTAADEVCRDSAGVQVSK